MFFETLEPREMFSSTPAPTPTVSAPSTDTQSTITYDNTADAKKRPPHKPIIVIIAILIG